MPGRATVKRAGTVLMLLAATICVAACGSTDNSWRGEFDARLEGAATAIEQTVAHQRPAMSQDELLRTSIGLARELGFKSELIAELTPPGGCESLNEEASKKVLGIARFSYDLQKNMTRYLQRHFRGDFKDDVTELEGLKREAAHC